MPYHRAIRRDAAFSPVFDLPLSEPVPILAAVMAVLLIAPLVAERWRVPGAVGLLLAGVVLGPNALGVLARDETIQLLGTLGLLYIMFIAGLEMDLRELRRHRARSTGFGALTFVLPQVLGTVVGMAVLGMGPLAAVLLGSVFASHTLLAYPNAQRLGIEKAGPVTMAVGATILTDTLALLVLAVVAAGAEGGGVEVLARVLGSLVAISVVVLWGVPRLGAWFFRAAPEGVAEFAFALTVLFGCALAVEVAGVEPIIGAFLAGLALNRLVPETGLLMARVRFAGDALFVPFFLVSTGMLVDPAALAEGGRVWLVAGVMVGTLLLTKGGAALLTRPLYGLDAAGAGVAFGLTVPQAAATLAATLVGFRIGLFDEAVLNGTIAMMLVTCTLGPILVERFGRRLAAQPKESSGAGVPSRVLVSLANPATVPDLLEVAALLRAAGDRDEPVQAVTVVPAGPGADEHVREGEHLLDHARQSAAAMDLPLATAVRSGPNVSRALARAAVETRSASLVLGWDGHPAAVRTLFGTIPGRVLRRSGAQLLVVRPGRPLATVRRMLVVAPPLAGREAGFGALAPSLRAAAGTLSASVAVLGPDAEALAPQIAPDAAALACPDWGDVLPAVRDALTDGDLLVLLSTREGAVSWTPSLSRLPRVLAGRYPEVPLWVASPASRETPEAPM